MDKKIEVRYLGFKSEFIPPTPLPFGAHKYIRALYPDRVPNLGEIVSTTYSIALVIDGVEGKPFEHTVKY